MNLRWKTFILLLAVSLIPLAVVTLLNHKASRKLSSTVITTTRQGLTETVRREIVSATVNYAQITRGAKSSMEFALQLMADKAGVLLGEPPRGGEPIYMAQDFEHVTTAPLDAHSSEMHRIAGATSTGSKQIISREFPSFYLPEGIDADLVHIDLKQLSGLSPTLKIIGKELGERAYWMYTSLESGVHISYPGHGGYPDDYDPRKQSWYLRAKASGTLDWSMPVMDSTTNQFIFTVSTPVYRTDGTFAGVSGIDVLLPTVLLENMISAQWSQDMVSFLFGHHTPAQGLGNSGWVLRQEREANSAGRHIAAKLSLNEDSEYFQLLENIHKNSSGSMEALYNGVDSFWAYSEIFPGLHFVIVAPESMVMELPNKVEEGFSTYTRGMAVVSAGTALVAVIVVGALAFLIAYVNSKNVLSITRSFKKLEQGDFSIRLSMKFNDERDLMVSTFNQIVPRLEEHLRMSSALGIAKEVQQSLLPRHNPEFAGYDIAGTSIYCEETGGDYYDFITHGDNRLVAVVGDVSGHGVPSALLMATARGLVMLRASMPGPAAEIINDVNRHLSQDTSQTGNFMTFFFCEVERESHQVRWVRAGHDPALIYSPAKDVFEELKGRGVAFGLDDTFEYEEYQREFLPGELILIGTDGIWEMRNEHGEMYGKERLMEIIRQNFSVSSKELIQRIADNLRSFRGEMRQEDDITLVVIKKEG